MQQSEFSLIGLNAHWGIFCISLEYSRGWEADINHNDGQHWQSSAVQQLR